MEAGIAFPDELLVRKLQALSVFDDSGLALDEELLDRMEQLSVTDRRVRPAMISLLHESEEWEPAWNRQDADDCLIKLYELDGDYRHATALLRDRFFAHRQEGTVFDLDMARQLTQQVQGYGLNPDPSVDLFAALPTEEAEAGSPFAAVFCVRHGFISTVLNEPEINFTSWV